MLKFSKTAILATALAMLFTPALVRAEDEAEAPAPTGKNWHFTIGVKGWVNSWSTSLGRYDTEGGNSVSIQDNGAFSAIPNLAFSYKKWSFFGSYFADTSYKFGTYEDVYEDSGFAYYTRVSTKADRSEWDFNVGYSFNSHVKLSVGYKEINKELTSQRIFRDYPSAYFFENPLRKQKASGPTIALSLNGDLTESGRIKMYGSGMIGFMSQKTDRARSTDTYYCGTAPFAGNIYCNESHFKEDQFYENFEVGFLFAPKSWALTLGYRYQVLEGKNKADANVPAFSFKSTDILRGPIFGVAYTF